MKKRAFTFILLCLAVGLFTTALAQTQYHTATVNGITWTYKLIGNNAAIVSPGAASNGPSEYSSWYDATWTEHLGTYTGVIKIPAELDGHPVTTISGGAFDGSSAKGYIFEETTQTLDLQGRIWKTNYNLGSPLQYIDMTNIKTPPTWVLDNGKISRDYHAGTFYRINPGVLIYLPNGTSKNYGPTTGWLSNEPACTNFIIDGECEIFKVFDQNFDIGGNMKSLTHNVYVPHAFTAKKATYDRTFSNVAGKAVSTLYLPYPTDLPTGMQAYDFQFKGVDASGDKAFCFVPVPLGTRLAANKPYLVRITDGQNHTLPVMQNVQVPVTPDILTTAQTSADGHWAFYGTTEQLDNADAYAKKAYYLNGNKWWAVQNGVTNDYIAPFRCFISSPTNATPAKSFLMVLDDDHTTTDIHQLENETEQDVKSGRHTFYSIDGKRMGTNYDTLERGQMYVVNGKKFYKF